MTSIRYFIPDDGDTEDEPNVFLAPKCPSAPKLADIKSSFPLPGKYHFRFKINLGGDNGLAVWMDCVDDRKPVPMYRNNMIIAKVTRISADDFSDDEDYDDDDDDMEFERLRAQQGQNGHSNTAAVQAAANVISPSNNNNNSYHRTLSGTSSVGSAGASNPLTPRASPTPTPPPSEDLLNVFEIQDSQSNNQHHSNPPSSNASANLLNEMDDFFSAAPTTATPVASDDFLGMTMEVPPASAQRHVPPPVSASSIPVRQPVSNLQQPQSTQRQGSGGYPNAFDQFSKKSEPFGGLNWK